MNLVFIKKKIKKKKIIVTIWGFNGNSNKGLIQPYTFLYIIIILTYWKIYFDLFTINDLQYFLFQMKIANAILHADKVLQRRGAVRDSLYLGL